MQFVSAPEVGGGRISAELRRSADILWKCGRGGSEVKKGGESKGGMKERRQTLLQIQTAIIISIYMQLYLIPARAT